MSSAKSQTLRFDLLEQVIQFMFVLKRIGPRTEPSSTPDETKVLIESCTYQKFSHRVAMGMGIQ